jgi:hypothetical protein
VVVGNEPKNKLIEFIKNIPSISKEIKDKIVGFLSDTKITFNGFIIRLRNLSRTIGKFVFEQIKNFVKTLHSTFTRDKKVDERRTVRDFEERIDKFYKTFLSAWKGQINLDGVSSPENIKKEKKEISDYVSVNGYKLDKKTKKILKYLINLPPKNRNSAYDFEDLFEIDVEVNENVDIYNKTNNMSISNSIRKVLSEQSEKTKSVLVEKEIIENRINYVLNSTNKINKKTVVIKESNNLLKSGYDKKLIKEVAKKYLN